nr:hypothetical protein [Tanacetum cinerariifolium]
MLGIRNMVARQKQGIVYKVEDQTVRDQRRSAFYEIKFTTNVEMCRSITRKLCNLVDKHVGLGNALRSMVGGRKGFEERTDDELTKKELKQIEADDQAIQTILLGPPEDIYAAVDCCEIAQEIWLRKEVDELKAERLAKTQDPLAIMANSNNSYAFPAPHQDQPSFNQNYMQQPIPNAEDITDPTTAMNMTLALMAKAFKLNYSTPTNNNQRISSNLLQNVSNQVIQNAAQNPRVQNIGYQNGLIGVPGNANQNLNGNGNLVAARAEGNAAGHNSNQIRCYNCRGVGHFARNCTVRQRRRDAAYLQTQLLIAQKEEAGIQLQDEEFDLMVAAADLDEIDDVNANCILMANLQQASTSGTQTDKAPVYDSDGSAEVHDYENCYDNEIFNMFTQEEQYTELLEPILEPHQVPHNDNNIIFEDSSVEQSREIVEQHPANFKETRALYDSLYQNLAIEVEKVNTTTYKNLFNSISVSRTQTKTIIASLQNELQNTIYENAKLRAQLFKKVFVQKDNTRCTSMNTKFAKQSILGKPPKVGEIHALSKPVTSNSTPTPQESKVVKNDKVIAPGSFRINPFKTSREEKHVPNNVRASARTKPITVSQPPVITKKDVNSDSNGLSSTGIDNTKTRRPQPSSNTKNDRVPSASKSSRSKNKGVEVEEHHRNLLFSKNTKHMSSACNNIKL